MKINSSVAANSYLLDAVTNNIGHGTSVRTFSLHSVRSIIMRLMMVMMIVGGWNVVRGQDVVYKTLTFPDDNNSNNHVQNYTSTWTAQIEDDWWSISKFNNNNWNWAYIKAGSKSFTSVATITTSAAYTEAITKVDITIDAITVDKINSIKLYTSSNGSEWTEAGSYTKSTGIQSVILSSPSANLYYKIEFDCGTGGSSNGFVTIFSFVPSCTAYASPVSC